MNRIILVGNGFDKAHGLPTGYEDFIDNYWTAFALKVGVAGTFKPYEDGFVKFSLINDLISYNYSYLPDEEPKSYKAFKDFLDDKNYSPYQGIKPICSITFKNSFFEHISGQSSLTSWLGIENEYYEILKDFLNDFAERKYAGKWGNVKELNDELELVKNHLEEYLAEIYNNENELEESIERAFKVEINLDDVAISKKELCLDYILREMNEFETHGEIEDELRKHPEYFVMKTEKEAMFSLIKDRIKNGNTDYTRPRQTLILNFNYTNTAENLYSDDVNNYSVINIHGELNSKTNPIIFGYGDELDDNYKEIEKTNNGDFMDNIKHIHYSMTNNYRRLLEFIQEQPYQVFTMGHSCGNSDRTLLQTVFEHPNCISVKPFFHKWEDENTHEIKDNYMDIYKNISRNFNDKKALRDIVVNKSHCESLTPVK